MTGTVLHVPNQRTEDVGGVLPAGRAQASFPVSQRLALGLEAGTLGVSDGSAARSQRELNTERITGQAVLSSQIHG